MTRIAALALVSASLLSACATLRERPAPQPGMDPALTHSVGFTGIGYEPL